MCSRNHPALVIRHPESVVPGGGCAGANFASNPLYLNFCLRAAYRFKAERTRHA
jgi:hypothetical protein